MPTWQVLSRTILTGVAALLLGHQALANPVITNPDFATPDYTGQSPGWAYLGLPSPALFDGWTYNQYVGVANVADGNWFTAPPPVGSQAAFFQNGTVSQAISGFIVGNSYNFSFYATQRTGHNPNPLTVTIGSTNIGTYTPPSSTSFTQFTTDNFIATSSTMTMIFSVNPPPCNPYSVTCDWASSVTDVTVQAPEPSSLAIFCSGLLLMVWMRRRPV